VFDRIAMARRGGGTETRVMDALGLSGEDGSGAGHRDVIAPVSKTCVTSFGQAQSLAGSSHNNKSYTQPCVYCPNGVTLKSSKAACVPNEARPFNVHRRFVTGSTK